MYFVYQVAILSAFKFSITKCDCINAGSERECTQRVIPLRFRLCKGDQTSFNVFIKWITYITQISIIFLFLAQTLPKVSQSAFEGEDGKTFE